MSETFQLRNDPPRQKRDIFEITRGKQRVLFSGMSLLRDQQDLFETDGEETKSDQSENRED